jgi:hypothetical protein
MFCNLGVLMTDPLTPSFSPACGLPSTTMPAILRDTTVCVAKDISDRLARSSNHVYADAHRIDLRTNIGIASASLGLSSCFDAPFRLYKCV